MNASYASGIWIAGSNASGTFIIKNIGNSDLIINNITSNKSWLSINPLTPALGPNDTITKTVTITNWNLIQGTMDTAIITIVSNDPDEPSTQVTVIAGIQAGSGIPELLISTDFYQDSILPDTNSSVTINVGVIGKDTVNWIITSSSSWLSLSDTSGVNDDVITVHYASNSTSSTRIGYVTITSSDVSNSPQIVSITQGTNRAPIISNVVKTTNNLTDTVYFTSSDFVSHFNDPDGNTLKYIRILSAPDDGILIVNNNPIIAYQSILENNIQSLVFIPNQGWDGNSTFEYNASDGVNFAINNSNVNITSLVNMDDYLLSENVAIFPNPSTGELILENTTGAEIKQITVFNSLGQKVHEMSVNKKSQTIKMNISTLPVGIYNLQIATDKGMVTKQVTVEKK